MTSPPTSPTRRSLLTAGVGVSVTALGGCASVSENDTPDDGSADADPDATANRDDGTPGGETPDEETHEFAIETVAEGFDRAWALACLPDDGLLVTERPGRLSLVDRSTGTVERVSGVPDVHAVGQGGLLDIALGPSFAADRWVYLTYAADDDAGRTTTHLGRGRLDRSEPELEAFETLHAAEPFIDSTGHYGSRVVVGADGALYVTVGDRQFKDFGPDHVSQDTTNELGTTLRLAPDGSVPDDNPFVDDPDALDTIYSYGHRNAQGMTVHPETDELWQSEHGERDGDLITVVRRGGNHGWPVAHYGCEYGTDDPVGDDPAERDDVVEPVYHWECTSGGFPPAGMTFYDGDAFPRWRGDLFVGNLADQYLGRFTVDGHDVAAADPLLAELGWRVRDVTVTPENGHLLVAVDEGDAPVLRLVPA